LGASGKMDNHVQVFVITLRDLKERQESIQSQLEKQNIPFEYVFGIDGRKLEQNEFDNYYDKQKNKKCYIRNLVKGEIACAASHNLCYKTIVERNIDRAIILEDDIYIEDGFREVYDSFQNFQIGKYIVKLDTREEMKRTILPWHKMKLNDQYYIRHSLFYGCGTGYYIDNIAANEMYNLTKKIFTVADDWNYFKLYIKIRILNKAVVRSGKVKGSIIWKNTERVQEKKRNIVIRIAKAPYKIIQTIFH
jgi:glycosyl transferase family 25